MRQWLFASLLVSHAAWAEDGPADLKPGADQELTSAMCGACHTSNYIVMNSPFLTADQWKAEVTTMRKAFGAPLDDATAAAITAYLAANYAGPAKP